MNKSFIHLSAFARQFEGGTKIMIRFLIPTLGNWIIRCLIFAFVGWFCVGSMNIGYLNRLQAIEFSTYA
jgi:hypothetical protein